MDKGKKLFKGKNVCLEMNIGEEAFAFFIEAHTSWRTVSFYEIFVLLETERISHRAENREWIEKGWDRKRIGNG